MAADIQERTPAFRKKAFACPHCHAFAAQRWWTLHAALAEKNTPGIYDLEKLALAIAETRDADDEEPRSTVPRYERLLKHLELSDPAFDTFWSHQQVADAVNLHATVCFVCDREAVWLAGELLYPERSADAPAPNVDLPAEIRADYEEAATIAPKSPRSAAALLRLSIQKLCEHILGDRGDDINAMIKRLVENGLPVRVQQALDVVRVIGNEAVHPGVIDLKDDHETVGRLFQLVNIVVDSQITQPKHVAELYVMIPESKRKAIEARDRKA